MGGPPDEPPAGPDPPAPHDRRRRLGPGAAVACSVALHAALVGAGLLAVRDGRAPPGLPTRSREEASVRLPLAAEEPLASDDLEPPPDSVEPELLAPDPAPPDPVASDEPPPEEPAASDDDAPPPRDASPVPSLPSPSVVGAAARPRPAAPSPPPAPPPPPTAAPSPAPRPRLRPLEEPTPPGVPTADGVERVVVLEYVVGADGRVESARVVESSGDPVLDETTRAFVLARWRYEPPGAPRRVVRRFVHRP